MCGAVVVLDAAACARGVVLVLRNPSPSLSSHSPQQMRYVRLTGNQKAQPGAQLAQAVVQICAAVLVLGDLRGAGACKVAAGVG
eukprot:362607-Chlamydomonas_euryale.AAC.13